MLNFLIPARGKSQGVPNKNLRKLGSRSLVGRAIDLAASICLEKTVILSTDSVQIFLDAFPDFDSTAFVELSEGSTLRLPGGVIIHKRQEKHATADSKTIDAVLDVTDALALNDTDLVVLLQPTSPFRNSKELMSFLDYSNTHAHKSLISAKRFDSPSPEKAFEVSSKFLRYSRDVANQMSTPRQALKEYYVSDGAYYMANVRNLIDFRSFITDKTLVFNRSGMKTLNIDSEEDLVMAELIYQKLDYLPEFIEFSQK